MASEFPKWRTELPIEPGWYWCENSNNAAEVVRVVPDPFGGDFLRVEHVAYEVPGNLAAYAGHRWSGPLTPPPTEDA